MVDRFLLDLCGEVTGLRGSGIDDQGAGLFWGREAELLRQSLQSPSLDATVSHGWCWGLPTSRESTCELSRIYSVVLPHPFLLQVRSLSPQGRLLRSTLTSPGTGSTPLSGRRSQVLY